MNKYLMSGCIFIVSFLFSIQSLALVPVNKQDLTEQAFDRTNNMNQRWLALMDIARSQSVQAKDILKRASVDKDWFMRSGSLVAMESVDAKESYELAKKLIKDKSLLVRTSAFEVLQKNLKTEDRLLLWEELNKKYNFRGNQSLWIRYQILELLGKNPQEQEQKQFANLLNDSDQKIQAISTNILNKFKN